MAVTCFADEITESFHADLQQSEWLLWDRAKRNQNLTPADYAFLARCGWDEKKAREEHRRVIIALTNQAICGSVADREAALQECDTAAKLLESEGPKIREKLDKLQKQLDGLERDARLSSKRCAEQSEAVAKLRELVPSHVRAKVDNELSVLNTEGVGATLRETKSRHHELVCILNVGDVYESPARHIEWGLRGLCPAAVTQTVEVGWNRYAYSPSWPALKSAAEVEFAELNSKLQELQAAYDAELAVIETALDFYSNGRQND